MLGYSARIILVSVLGCYFIVRYFSQSWDESSKLLEDKKNQLIVESALSLGDAIARQVASTRAQYTKDIVGSLKPQGVVFNQDPKPGEAPLPAVFIKHISEDLKSDPLSPSFVLRSKWNLNTNQGLATSFEQKGWENLEKQEVAAKVAPLKERIKKYKPYYEKMNDGQSSFYLIMTPDLASAESCVSCHNAWESKPEMIQLRKAPQKVFQLGDLMGAVVIKVPLDNTAKISNEFSTLSKNMHEKIEDGIFLGSTIAFILSLIIAIDLGFGFYRLKRRLKEVATGSGNINNQLKGSLFTELSVIAKLYNLVISKVAAVLSSSATTSETISKISKQLISTSQNLKGRSENAFEKNKEVNKSLNEIQSNFDKLRDGSKEMSDRVQTVAASTTEMSSSLDEVAKSAAKAADVACETATLTKKSNNIVEELRIATNEIGSIIDLIQKIASQTNLLALNATIEAARAGELGKGFSVVANEVKDLAKQTSDATDGISNKVKKIQETAKLGAQSIQQILLKVDEVNSASQIIAAAVEEQNVTNKGIAENVNFAARYTSEVSESIEGNAQKIDRILELFKEFYKILEQDLNDANQIYYHGEELLNKCSEIDKILNTFKKS